MADDQGEILNPRRARRAAVRCAVEIRRGLAVWDGETEDIAPGGCRIAAGRVVAPGSEVKLAIRCAVIQQTLALRGTVVWAHASAPSRLGVAFEPPGAEPRWLAALLASHPGARREESGAPDRLAAAAPLHLGEAPRAAAGFTPVELDVLRRVGAGATAGALARSFADGAHGAALGALFALLARGCLVTDRAAAADPSAWSGVLGRQDDRRPSPEAIRRALVANRSIEAQRLYDEALAHIGSGRLSLAMERLREALQHSPDDPAIASTAKRIGRWAVS